MPADQSQANTGMFVPETNVWEIAQLSSVDVTSPAFKELLVRLYQNINNISIALNQKETGVYALTEFLNSQAWFPNPVTSAVTNRQPQYRGDFRMVVNFGQLPNTGTKSVAHGMTPTSSWTWTLVRAAATDSVNLIGIDLPYASPVLANNIELFVDATNVTVITGSDRTNFDRCLVVIEMLKN